MKKPFYFLILAITTAWLWSCTLSEDSGKEKHYLSLLVEDTLTQFDTVRIILKTPAGDSVAEIWNDRLEDTKSLNKVEVKNYDGGDVDVVVVAIKDKKVAYFRIIHYRGPATKPIIDSPSLPDYVPPALVMDGPGMVTLAKGQAFDEPPVTCRDSGIAGNLPVKVQGAVNTAKVGVYLRLYSCSDTSGNVTRGLRQFAIEEPSAVLPAIKEASLDTNHGFSFNNGGDPTMGFTRYSGDEWISILQFGMDRIDKSRVTSAKVVFNAFGMDSENWDGTLFTLTFRVNRLTQPWIEGSGNRYYHDGAWVNSGETYLSNYAMRPEVLHVSLDPAKSPGVNKDNRAMFRAGNMIPVGQPQQKTVRFTLAQSAQPCCRPLPDPGNLVPLEIDLTDYVKTSLGASDYGMLITFEGLGNRGICVATKELGDGSLGPKLFLDYTPRDTTPTVWDDSVAVEKDTEIDTLNTVHNPNQGYTPCLLIGRDSADGWASFMKFNLADVRRADLKMAQIRLQTFLVDAPEPWKRTLKFKVYALESDWIEGTGNWYFHRGVYQNGGATFFSNYGITTKAMAGSTDPVPPNGIASNGMALIRRDNMTYLKSVSQELDFPFTWNHIGSIPPRQELRTLLIDVTEYVKAMDPVRDFGFLITVESGILGSERVCFFSKEGGDGTLGPKLMLGY